MTVRIVAILLLASVVGCKPTANSGGANASSSSATSTTAGATSLVGPGKVIPVGRIAVEVMEFGTPPRVAELARREFQARLKDKDQQWWQDRSQQAKAGKSVPYDPRTGLTQAEYEELERLKQQKLRQKAAATIDITRGGPDLYVLNGGTSLPELTGVVIDLKNDQVRTPFGTTAGHSALTMPESSTLGAWSGIHWKLETPAASAETGTTVSLSFGRMASGRGILRYYVRKLTPPEEKKRVNVMLFYDLPAAP